jgi:Holliday junction resolvasome RuvABC ATP-dependent DNA helicase subunit
MNEAEERIISPLDAGEDGDREHSLRPRTLKEYIGQPAMREKL